MKLKKSEKRMLIILGVVVAAVIIFQFVTGGKEETDTTVTTTQPPGTQNVVSSPSVDQIKSQQQPDKKPKAKKIYNTWGDNPFSVSSQPKKKTSVSTVVRAESKSEDLPKHKFLGVFETATRKYALIDDLVIAEGDAKEGIEVVKIEKNRVTCRKKGKTFTLYWSEEL